MVTVGMNYEVLPGKEEAFEEGFAHVLKALEAADGHTASHLYKEVGSPRSYLIVSEWNDKSAFIEFIRSQGFKDVTVWGREEILAVRPRHRIYDRGETF